MKRQELKTELPGPRYSKKEILATKKFAPQRDLLEALLRDGQNYSVKEAETLLKNYKERKI